MILALNFPENSLSQGSTSMSFELHADESLTTGCRRVLVKEVKKALDELSDAEAPDAEEDVHEARKRFKKVRAVLKLVRKGLGSAAYRRENAAFRDAGRPLTEVRDARVLLDTLDRLARRAGAEVSPEALAPVREALLARRQAIRNWVLEESDALAGVRAALAKERRRLKRLSLKGGWSVVSAGLKKTYSDGLTAFDRATSAPTDENLHEWRKRVKDLYLQLQFLHGGCPELLGQAADKAHKLADALGDDHDLAVLAGVLAGELQKDGPLPVVEQLVPLVRRWRGELQGQARELGMVVYRDAPGVFVSRLKGPWKAWRARRKEGSVS
jgi:CHAD domain-containing protein